MVVLTQEEKKVVALFQSLEPGRRRRVLLEMARSDTDAWRRFQAEGEGRLRDMARENGLDWDHMDDDARQDFIEGQLGGEGR